MFCAGRSRLATRIEAAVIIATNAIGVAPAFAAEPIVLTVAADPNNLPFSNDHEEGFENKLAKMLSSELGAELRYVWHAQRRGFLRDTLGEGKCDLVLGVPEGNTQCLATTPYYRSGYAFVTRASRQQPKSLDDSDLRKQTIGVQLPGDGQLTPPANVLVARGLAANLVPFSLYSDFRAADPPAQVIRDVASGNIDVAVAWGPLAGYFAQRERPPLRVRLIPEDNEFSKIPFAFSICIGVRKGNESLRDELNRAIEARRSEIRQLLDDYHVPQLELNHPRAELAKEAR